jgi:hypothetical protein
MSLVVDPGGVIRCLYAETIDLSALCAVSIRRASHVETDADGKWHADLSPVCGPVLGPYHKRSEALEAEVGWLEANWLA